MCFVLYAYGAYTIRGVMNESISTVGNRAGAAVTAKMEESIRTTVYAATWVIFFGSICVIFLVVTGVLQLSTTSYPDTIYGYAVTQQISYSAAVILLGGVAWYIHIRRVIVQSNTTEPKTGEETSTNNNKQEVDPQLSFRNSTRVAASGNNIATTPGELNARVGPEP